MTTAILVIMSTAPGLQTQRIHLLTEKPSPSISKHAALTARGLISHRLYTNVFVLRRIPINGSVSQAKREARSTPVRANLEKLHSELRLITRFHMEFSSFIMWFYYCRRLASGYTG